MLLWKSGESTHCLFCYKGNGREDVEALETKGRKEEELWRRNRDFSPSGHGLGSETLRYVYNS